MIGQFGFVDIDQRTVVNEEVFSRGLPFQHLALLVYFHSTAGNDEVDVRMVDHRITAPSVQYSEVAQLATS